MAKRALITGITGQDGSYLAELLLEKGYEVHGMVRRSSSETFQRLTRVRDDLVLHTGDLLDQRSLVDVLRACRARRDLQPRRHVLRRRVLVPAGADRGVHRGRRRRACSRRCATSRPTRASTRRPPRRCSARCSRSPRPRRPPSTPAARTAWRRPTATSSRSTTASPTTCSPARGSSSTTRAPRRGLEFVTRKVTHAAAAIKLGLAGRARPRQPRRGARLGLREGLRRGDVADAPAATSPRTT